MYKTKIKFGQTCFTHYHWPQTDRKFIAEREIIRLSRSANEYEHGGFIHDAKRLRIERQEFLKDFPEFARLAT